jgi:hypothetical protein
MKVLFFLLISTRNDSLMEQQHIKCEKSEQSVGHFFNVETVTEFVIRDVGIHSPLHKTLNVINAVFHFNFLRSKELIKRFV